MNLFGLFFLAALSGAQKPIETCTKETLKCPITKEQWDKRYREFHCFEEGTNYTCLQARGGVLVEACSYPDIIEGSMGKCPVFYTCDGTIPVLGLDTNFNDCPDNVKGCPGKYHPKYTVNEMYKYPACITIDWTELSASTELTVKPETENESDDDEHMTIYIVLPIAICVVIITSFGAVLWFFQKRKAKNRELLRQATEESQPLSTIPAGEPSMDPSEEQQQVNILTETGEPSMDPSDEQQQVNILTETEILSEKFLARLSMNIGKEWTLVCVLLGVPQHEIDHIILENLDIKTTIYRGLLRWRTLRQGSSREELLSELREALTENGRQDLVEKFLKDVNEERLGTVNSEAEMRSKVDQGTMVLYSRSSPEMPSSTIRGSSVIPGSLKQSSTSPYTNPTTDSIDQGIIHPMPRPERGHMIQNFPSNTSHFPPTTYASAKHKSLRDTLHERYKVELKRIRASPLQKTSNIPIQKLYSPVSIREDLEYKYRGRKMGRGDVQGKCTKAVEGPEDLFIIENERAENIFMIGDAGYGKSVFCLRLIHYWLKLEDEKNKEPKDEEWIQYLQTFDFIFLVRLRRLDESQKSLASMICNDLFKNDHKFHKPIYDVLSNDDRHCLVIIDGLDEAKLETGVLPTTEGLNNCTLFWTSRPWKLDEFSDEIHGRDRVVEIHGLNDKGVEIITENILVHHLGLEKESLEYKRVEEESKQEKMISILKNPLMAMACIELWHENMKNENKNVRNSLTSIHIALLDLLVKNAQKKGRITTEIKEYCANLPQNHSALFVLRKHEIDKVFICVLVNFGKVAYDDLSSEKPSLVFKKSSLEKILEEKDLSFGLQTGLLSLCEAPAYCNVENVSVNFFHKSIQEFLAAIFIEVNKSLKDTFFSDVLSSIEKILEFENVLIFLSGLEYRNLGRISSHIVRIADGDPDICSYREFRDLFHRKKRVELLYRLQSRCLRENKNEFCEGPENPEFHVADINIHFENGKELIDDTKDIMKNHNNDVKSLWIEWVPNDSNKGIPDDTVAEFLEQAKSLKSLCINSSRDKKIRTLHNVSEVFPSLTALVLLKVTLTPESLNTLLKEMQSNTVLMTFGFTTRNMEPIGQRTQPPISRLIDILPGFKSLSTLYIRIENPDDKPSLINALSQMKNLHTIYYYGIDPAEDPFNQNVAEKICQMNSLHTLGLCILTIGKDDARVSLSPDMTKLEQVMIYETEMTDVCWRNFLRSMHKIRCNQEIHVFVETNNEYGNGLKIIRSCDDFEIVDDQTDSKDEYGHYNITFKKPATYWSICNV